MDIPIYFGCSIEGNDDKVADSGEFGNMTVILEVNGNKFDVILENNQTAQEFYNLSKFGLTLSLNDYAGFEKVGELDTYLSRDDKKITTSSGDIVLYNGNNLVIFYGPNSWSYTKIGRITNIEKWEAFIGNENIIASFKVK